MADGRTPVAGIEATNKRISALVERYRKVRAFIPSDKKVYD